MSDPFASTAQSLSSPATDAVAITPDDTVPLATPSRALYIGEGGDLRVEMLSGNIVTLPALIGGAVYPFRVNKVLATGTTATGIISLR